MSIAGISATALLAFAGALLTMAVVWSLARAGGKFAIENMLLAGFAIGTMLNAATSALELGKEASNPGVRMLTAWLHGEVSVPSWTQVLIITVVEVAALVLAIPLARQLNTLALGEEYAEQLGVRVGQLRILVVAIGSILTALAVSLGGLIGFVGLLVPHVLRIILGPDHFRLLPAAALSGAMFLIVADTIARTAFAPTEIPVGLLTAFIGGPAFLYLLNQKKRGVLLSSACRHRVPQRRFRARRARHLRRSELSGRRAGDDCAVGPNGVGKTTLLKIVAGLLRPTSGAVLLQGRELESWSRRELSCYAALVPQHLDVPFAFRVEELVAQGRVPHLRRFAGPSARDLEVVERAMQAVDILGMRERAYSELSGGERQRVKIAIGLAQQPKVMMLDEPTQAPRSRTANRTDGIAAEP